MGGAWALFSHLSQALPLTSTEILLISVSGCTSQNGALKSRFNLTKYDTYVDVIIFVLFFLFCFAFCKKRRNTSQIQHQHYC